MERTPGALRAPRGGGGPRRWFRSLGRTWSVLALVVLVSGAGYAGRGVRPAPPRAVVPAATLLPARTPDLRPGAASAPGADTVGDADRDGDHAAAPVLTSPAAPRNPVTLLDAPDPAVLRTEDGYLAFSTQSRGQHLPVLASRDLQTWTEAGDALPQLPAWSRPGHVWAPDVWRLGDRHVLYYTTVDAARGLLCISAAESVAPEGPYVDRSAGPVVCQYDRGGSIDPSPFRDADGRPYLFWKSEGRPGSEPTRVWVAPLAADGLAIDGEPHEVLQQDREWEAPILEGPDMVLVDGIYHLFYSANRWETADYAIGHAICASVRGPCEKTSEGPWLRVRDGAVGSGGPDVFTDTDGRYWLAYHAWPADAVGYPAGARRLQVEPLDFVHGGPGPARAQLPALLDAVSGPPTGRHRHAGPATLAG